MEKKIKISIAAVAALMLVILSVNLAMAATSAAITPAPTAKALETIEKINQNSNIVISPEQAENKEQLKELTPSTSEEEIKEQLKEMVPPTFEEAEASILPQRARFLMWTYDGVHIMWGIYGNGRFVGTDNLGKRCWGIYGNGIFAGFYDGEFFWGKYSNGAWKAQGLFGSRYTYGKYVLFPSPAITTSNAVVP